MLDILLVIPGKKRSTPSGWHVFNAVCCHHRGHNRDKRQRAGIKFSDAVNWSYHCFNCGYKCGITVGKSFSSNTKQLLAWCGVDAEEIERLSFQSFSQRGAGADQWITKKAWTEPEFTTTELPKGARPLTILDMPHIEYLARRGLAADTYPYHVVDGEARQRIIIPFYYRGKIVGHTSRYYDDRQPKYITESQRGYVFNIDGQKREWTVCILVEGQFDAISIGGMACMTNTISDEQAALIKGLGKHVIFVPDRDKAGLSACDRALELGFSVSIPEWGSDVKDVNDAVKKYGRLPTLLSILDGQTSSRITVQIKKGKLA